MADQSMDALRTEQGGRIAAAAAVGFNVTKPLFRYQTSLLRLIANNFELLARNYERGMEVFSDTIAEQHHQAREGTE